jgi:hypothetical protein
MLPTAEKCRILLSASCVSFRELVADYVVRAGQDFSASETKNLATVDLKKYLLAANKNLKEMVQPPSFCTYSILNSLFIRKMKTNSDL